MNGWIEGLFDGWMDGWTMPFIAGWLDWGRCRLSNMQTNGRQMGLSCDDEWMVEPNHVKRSGINYELD